MKKIEDIKEFKDIDTYYEISKIVDEVFQDRVEAHKHLVTANKEIERLNNKEEQLIRRLEDLIIVGEQVENEWAIDICKMIIKELKGSDSNVTN